MVTIREVAKQAGVSVATVSRVMNQSDKVSGDLRLKVEQVIGELNYEPSIHGRNLRTAKSKLLLVLLPSVANPFYADIISGIEDTAIAEGYNILLCETDSNPEREIIYFNLIKNRLADGVISMDPTVNKERLMKLAEKFPIVQCSEYDKEGTLSYVTIDNELAAYRAVKHLLKLGRKKVAIINSDKKFLYARERYSGYKRALKKYNISVRENWVYNTKKLEFEAGQHAMKVLLQQSERPTAVFAVSDVLAIGALKELNTNGFNVPKDIAIIGFDKINFSNMTYPTLTTVAQPMYKMGCISAEMVINKIRGKRVESVILDHELIIRETT